MTWRMTGFEEGAEKETADPASLVAKPVSRIAKKAAGQMLNRTRLVLQMSMYAKRQRNAAGFFVA